MYVWPSPSTSFRTGYQYFPHDRFWQTDPEDYVRACYLTLSSGPNSGPCTFYYHADERLIVYSVRFRNQWQLRPVGGKSTDRIYLSIGYSQVNTNRTNSERANL